MGLSRIQKISKFFASKKKFEDMKHESQLWGFNCKSCDKRVSIWEIGGVRYKAKGTPSTRIRCPHCETIEMQKITKQSS